MDSINVQYRNIVEKVMQEYIDFLGSDDQVQAELVFDHERERSPISCTMVKFIGVPIEWNAKTNCWTC